MNKSIYRNIQPEDVNSEVMDILREINLLKYAIQDSERFDDQNSCYQFAVRSLQWAENHLKEIQVF